MITEGVMFSFLTPFISLLLLSPISQVSLFPEGPLSSFERKNLVSRGQFADDPS